MLYYLLQSILLYVYIILFLMTFCIYDSLEYISDNDVLCYNVIFHTMLSIVAFYII